MQGFVKFNKGVMSMPKPIKAWLFVLIFFNGFTPILFLHHTEAQATLAAIFGAALLMSFLTARFGFTRILGLGHILWIPLVGWLAMRLNQIPPDDSFGLWVRGVIVVNSLSLIMDIIDVIRYARGDHKELVPDL
ncbi:hypothetical protein [Gimesia aquarii]|uniref:SPW repeat protein n=1 Tax=Gimesia aquarii TaxID=2527964 RepID=A0A517WR39_9PLAN|nr:hypothetical protein [Gimesia aquarii]QDU07726.1 hypothetical protein V202x_10870 [Gimesia aquarii]